MKPLLALAMAAAAVTVAAQPTAWKQAAPGRVIALPADHASHPDYRLEWWYYTGHLDAADGRRFGYQVTFFRVGVDPAPANPSRWAVRDLVMTHVAVTDVEGRRFRFADRLNRPGPGWAGAATDRYHVWNDDWAASLDTDGVHHLRARAPDFSVDLRLTEARPPVLHGDRGYSRKGSDPGNASYYYSLTRLPTRGVLTLDGRAIPVTGLSWMDHEFGTSFLEDAHVGWDWLSLQFDDGRDVMIFQIRRADGSIDPRSGGTLVEAGGRTVPITAADRFRLEPGRVWQSPASGGRYPVEWTVRLPGRNLDLAVSALIDDQELRTTRSTGVTYWEGAVDVSGRAGSRPVRGRGYLEMTGYAGASMSTFMR